MNMDKTLIPLLASAAFFCAGHLKATTYSYDFSGYITEEYRVDYINGYELMPTMVNLDDQIGKIHKPKYFEHGPSFSGNLTWSDATLQDGNYYSFPGIISFSVKGFDLSTPSTLLTSYLPSPDYPPNFSWWVGWDESRSYVAFDGMSYPYYNPAYNGLFSIAVFPDTTGPTVLVDVVTGPDQTRRESYIGRITEGTFSTVPVPDSGTTLVMLASALGGLWLLKRRAFSEA